MLAKNDKISTEHVSRAHGAARMAVFHEEGRTAIRSRYSSQPYRLLFPRPESDEVLQVVLSNLSGGMLNGDVYDLEVTCDSGSDMLFTGQAAEKIYKAADQRDTMVNNVIRLEDAAALEWLPQGTIQFDGARMQRQTDIHLNGSGKLIAGELLYLGRTAMGEKLTSGLLKDVWRLHRDGQLVWEDRMMLHEGNMAALDHPTALDGAAVTGMLFYAGPDAAEWLEPVREQFCYQIDSAKFGVSLVNGILLTRWLGKDGQAIRQHLGEVAEYLRHEVMGRPARLPRIWHI